MALMTNATQLANLFNPEVVAGLIENKLVDAMRFAPLARIDTTLVGRAGDTVTLPAFNYIGDATTVAEGEDIPIKQLTQSTTEVTIHKIGNGVLVTDEAALSGYGDPIDEAVSQIALSIASQVDNEMLDILTAIGEDMTHVAAKDTIADDISDALTLFGEDIEGPKVLLIDPEVYAVIRKANGWIPGTEAAASAIMRGSVGMIHGCEISLSNKLKGKGLGFIVRPGALASYMKRDTLVETDRDIVKKATIMTADKHFANYLYNASGAIKLVIA